MPTSVAVAVAAEVVGSYVAGSAIAYAAIASTSWLTYSMIATAATVVAGGVLRNAISSNSGGGGGGGQSAQGFVSEAQGRMQVVRSSAANRTIVYGRAMVSGPLVFAATSGSSNSTLHLIIPLAGHEIDAVEKIYFNDVELGTRDGSGNVTSGQFAGKATVKVHLGTAGDAADSLLVGAGVGWTSAHKLSGVAYLYVQLTWDQDTYPTGIPNIKAQIRGKKLYDPRTGTTAWSTNSALVVRDYLLGSYGLAATSAELDDTLLIAAANVCDESVAKVGGTESRYTCNGVVDMGDTPRSIIENILSSMAGFMVWSSGKYCIYAGAYTAPSVTLTVDDLRGPLKVRPRIARNSLFNAIRGTFVDPDNYWQAKDFPVVTNSTYATQDGGAVLWRDIVLPFTTSSATAQRIGKIMLERSRQGITVEFPAKLTALKIGTLDTVRVTVSHLGWTAKEFKVLDWKFSAEGGVDLVLQEETADSYNWNSGNQTVIDAAPDTLLPNPFTVTTPGKPTIVESLYQTTGSAGVKTKAVASWTSLDTFAVAHTLRYKPLGDLSWIVLSPSPTPQATVDDMVPGMFEFQTQTTNSIGVRSAWSASTVKEIIGLSSPPSDVTGFSVTKSAGFAMASWNLQPDLDVRIGGRIVIRHSSLSSGAIWTDGIVLQDFNGDAVNGLVPLMQGTYMAKAVDSTGNYSTNAVSFVATEGLVTGFTTVGSSVQHSAFSGAKTNVALVGSGIQLLGAGTIDSAGMFDTLGGLDALGGILPEGTYEFNTYLDLSTVATRRFQSTLTAASFAAGSLLDEITTLVDDWSPIDGNTINSCDVTLYAATTNDDPAGSPTWSAWAPFFVADFTCRAAKFKVVLTSSNTQHNIRVSALKVDALTPA